MSVYRRVFRSLVELEDTCKSDHKAVENILLKSIVLGDIPTLQKLHGKCIYTVGIFSVLLFASGCQLYNLIYVSHLFTLTHTAVLLIVMLFITK